MAFCLCTKWEGEGGTVRGNQATCPGTRTAMRYRQGQPWSVFPVTPTSFTQAK